MREAKIENIPNLIKRHYSTFANHVNDMNKKYKGSKLDDVLEEITSQLKNVTLTFVDMHGNTSRNYMPPKEFISDRLWAGLAGDIIIKKISIVSKYQGLSYYSNLDKIYVDIFITDSICKIEYDKDYNCFREVGA